MLPVPIPTNEAQRLATLRSMQLLDTPPEARFDLITQTAVRLLNAPVAMLTLVDADREWFKSRQGLSASEGPRATSFCGHALVVKGVFIVPDAKVDPRFADNPAVMFAPHIRFYAGTPLCTPDGSRIGVLCIKDYRPRQLSAAEAETLKFLASWAERELNNGPRAAGTTKREPAGNAVFRS